LLCRQLIKSGQGLLFGDPHGHTFYDLLEWLAYIRPKRKIYIIDTTDPATQGFSVSACKAKDEAHLMTSVSGKVRATLRAWGAKDESETPRLAKWLRCIYWALAECNLPLEAVEYFLDYEAKGKREEILSKVSHPTIKRQLAELCNLTQQAYKSYLESTENRLQIFLHPQVKRILSRQDIDLGQVMDEGAIVLMNLQSSPLCDEATATTIGTLIINELTHQALQRPKGSKRFYLILDECHRYLTGDVKTIVDEARKYGLSLLAFHQRVDQLPKDIAASLTGCKVKLIFSTANSPKPPRHFECQIRAQEPQVAVVPEVHRHPFAAYKVQEYKRAILGTIDRPVGVTENKEKEWHAKDYFRKR
jgi:hypothetical protein